MQHSPSFQFYPSDWISDPRVAIMSAEKRGIYIHLLSYMWLSDDCALPYDLASLSELCKGGSTVVEAVIRDFFILDENSTKFSHKRLQKERAKQLEWRMKSSEGGKKSAEGRAKSKVKGGSRVVQPKGQPKGNSSYFNLQSSSSSSFSNSLKEKKSTEVDSGVPENSEVVVYGNQEITKLLNAIKLKVGIADFSDSQKWQRIYGKHLISLMAKIKPTEFARRLDILKNDSFKRKRLNEVRYVYEQVKGFVEPPERIAIIS